MPGPGKAPKDGDVINGKEYYLNPTYQGQPYADGWYDQKTGEYYGNDSIPGDTPVKAGGGAAAEGGGQAGGGAAGQQHVTAQYLHVTAQYLYEQQTGEKWPPAYKNSYGEPDPARTDSAIREWTALADSENRFIANGKGPSTFERQSDGSIKVTNSKGGYEAWIRPPPQPKQPTIEQQLAEAFQKAQRTGDYSEYNRLFTAAKGPAARQPGPDKFVKQPDGSTVVLDEHDRFRHIIPAPKTPTLDELQVEAILSGNRDAALALWEFRNMPSQAERLNEAIKLAHSPADYLAVVGMMRGEIPITPQPYGSNRIGPQSQAFNAMGFPDVYGGQGANGGNPLDNPALRDFMAKMQGGIASPNGFYIQGGNPNNDPGLYLQGSGGNPNNDRGLYIGGNQLGTQPPYSRTNQSGQQPAVAAAPRQAMLATTEEESGQPGFVGPAAQLTQRINALTASLDTAQSQEERNAIEGQITQAQNEQAKVFQDLHARPYTPDTGVATSGQGLEARVREGAGLQQGQYYSADTGRQLSPDEIATLRRSNNGQGLDQMLGVGAVKQGISGAPQGQGGTTLEQRLARQAYANESAAIASGAKSYNPAEYADYQRRGAVLGATPAQPGYRSPASGQGLPYASDLSSTLRQAYGQDVLTGRGTNHPSMSYAELGNRQGIFIPPYRSAQQRLNQSPLEQRLFEAGLANQIGADNVEDYLARERFATTPGGRPMGQIQVMSR